MVRGQAKSTARSAQAATATPDHLSAAENAHWYTSEVHELLKFLGSPDIKGKVGDNGNYPGPVWTAASNLLNPKFTKGAPKTAKVCKNKYGQLCAQLKVVLHVQGNSGWHWDDVHGANIDSMTKATWDEYLKAHPKAKHYRNKGWPFRAAMVDLVPSRTSGAHVFRATQGTQAGDVPDCDDKDDEEDGMDMITPEVPSRLSDPEWDLTALERTGSSPSVTGHNSASASQLSFHNDAPAPTQKKCPASTPALMRPQAKKARSSPSDTLSQLAASVNVVGESIHEAMAPPDCGGLEATPRRKQCAILRAQQLEADWLPEDQLVRFINILQTDTSSVDTYSFLLAGSLRKSWIKNKLGIDFNFMDMADTFGPF